MAKRAVITGGQGDLGEALHTQLKASGYEVLAPGREELDVTDDASVDAFFKVCGEVDLLVCNAGKTEDGLLAKMSETVWDRVMEVNLKGAFRCARAVSKAMLKRRSGHVVFVSSYSAFHPPLGQANYSAAKAGLEGMCKSLAQEWGGCGVRVNLIVPGFMETRMTESLNESVLDAVKKKHVLFSFNSPDKVAQFVRFLDQTMTQTSGQVFNLDSRIL
ncbi:SDR family NAD(P)-dependent oxidoreductase [Rubritalea spongiae]|uniref:SDR family NAD(P)-dependent oxidoreductase n=1 Tax=Rubritalea spongiae TaxID=430797 RepID=A0ABW5E6U5_9BACT